MISYLTEVQLCKEKKKFEASVAIKTLQAKRVTGRIVKCKYKQIKELWFMNSTLE